MSIFTLNDYFLMRLFSSQQYLTKFIEGEVFFNNIMNYREMSNSFQGDEKEGTIIAETNPFEMYINYDTPRVQYIGKTKNLILSLNGYACCFFLLPKEFFNINNGELEYDTNSPYLSDVKQCMNEYNDGKPFFCIVDAYNFLNNIGSCMKEIGCGFVASPIEYKDMSTTERVSLYRNKQYIDLVMTKPTKYKYQNEYRIFIHFHPNGINDHTFISNVNVKETVFVSGHLNQ